MKNIEKKENPLVFSAEIEETLANALRRYLNQIPVLAVDEVEISKNDSPLYDETIAHRIGLIPLKNKAGKELKMKLSAKDDVVYSGEFKGEAEVVYDKIPITILEKGQELELIATTRIGKGEEHARFTPGLMFYRNIANVKVDKDCPKEAADACPQNVFEIKDGKVVVKGAFKCDMCEACVDVCKKKGKECIELIPTSELLITLESFGQMPASEMFRKSIEQLKKDLAEVAKKVAK